MDRTDRRIIDALRANGRETYAELARRAEEAHQSLQQYLRGVLVRQAHRPDPRRFWSEVDDRLQGEVSSLEMTEAVADVRAMRDEQR